MSPRHRMEHAASEAALENVAWDDLERYVLDESAVPAPLRLSRIGDIYPPSSPPTRRGSRDPRSSGGSGTSDGQTGSHGAAADSCLPSDPHYVAAAFRSLQLDDRSHPGSGPRRVSDTSRPPLTPTRTSDTSRPPLTPLRMGRPGLPRSPQSPACCRSSGSSGHRQRLSRRITSSDTSLGLSSWSTTSSAGSAASRGSPSASSARALRAGGRRLSQGLGSVGRAAQGLLLLGKRAGGGAGAGGSFRGCPRHGLELCHPCMFRVLVLPGATYDEAGKVVIDDKVDAPPEVALEPAYGRAARFRPLYDGQLRAADPSGGGGDPGTMVRVPACYAEPRPGWFTFCGRCELTHLVGVAGPGAAAHHPSHCATAEAERSVAVWVDAEPRWGSPLSPRAGRYSVYWGPGSRHNRAGVDRGFANAPALEFGALARALRRAETVLDLRRALVARRGISNSHAHLWRLTRFRLLVFAPLKSLGEWLQTEGPGGAPETVAHFLNYEKMNISPRQTWLDQRRQLDEAIARLAALGVEVSFFPWRTQGYTPEWEMFA